MAPVLSVPRSTRSCQLLQLPVESSFLSVKSSTILLVSFSSSESSSLVSQSSMPLKEWMQRECSRVSRVRSRKKLPDDNDFSRRRRLAPRREFVILRELRLSTFWLCCLGGSLLSIGASLRTRFDSVAVERHLGGSCGHGEGVNQKTCFRLWTLARLIRLLATNSLVKEVNQLLRTFRLGRLEHYL